MKPNICIKKLSFLVILVVFITKQSSAQEISYYYEYEPIPYVIDKKSKNGYDKSGRKQGKWQENCMYDCVVHYKDSLVWLEPIFCIGYYVDDLKQGMWDIYDKADYDTRNLIAQTYYDKGMMVFQLTYIDNVLVSFIRLGTTMTPINTDKGIKNDIIYLDGIYFDEDNNVYRELYTPNGVLKKYHYPKKTKP